MERREIVSYRLANQRISCAGITAKIPEETLTTMGALQAQDYPAALWAIGLRLKDSTQKDVEEAIAKRRITRTWLMRGTLHFAKSADIYWMLNLFAPRLLNTAISRDRHLGLSDNTINKAKMLFKKALKGDRQLTRNEMYSVLEKGGIRITNQLGYHMLYRAAWDGLICFGLHDDKQPTFALLDEWIGERRSLSNDAALAELASRYFISHGPATIKDYVWWSGLRSSDAKIGIEKAGSRLVKEKIDGKIYYMPKKHLESHSELPAVYLLPAFDEYLVGYSDRSAMLGNKNTQKMLRSGKITFVHSNGIFLPTIVIDGEVVGTWRRKNVKGRVEITIQQFAKLNKDKITGVKEAADTYGNFIGMPVTLK